MSAPVGDDAGMSSPRSDSGLSSAHCGGMSPHFGGMPPQFGGMSPLVEPQDSSDSACLADDDSKSDGMDGECASMSPPSSLCLANDDEVIGDPTQDDGGADSSSEHAFSSTDGGVSDTALGRLVPHNQHGAPARGCVGVRQDRGLEGLSPASLLSAYTWANVVVTELRQILGPSILQSSLLCLDGAVATQFSGIGCAEIALEIVVAAVLTVCGSTVKKPIAWACEKNQSCSTVLQQGVGRHCIFTDIGDFCAGAPLPDHASGVVDYMAVRAAVHSSPPSDGGRCSRHLHSCRCAGAQGFVAGSPCQLWSSFGKRRGRQDGRISLLLVWLHTVRSQSPLWAVHENVPGFDTRIIEEELGADYIVQHFYVSPRDVGFAFVRRTRVYTIAFRANKVVMVRDIGETYARVARKFQTSPQIADAFIATESQILEVENRARAQRRLAPLDVGSADWSYMFTAKQQEYVCELNRMWRDQLGTDPDCDANCVYDLSQNPRFRPRASFRGILPAVTTSALFWSPMRKRYMLPVELAVAGGIPVIPALASVCNIHHVGYHVSPAQVGNAMHVANMGMFLAVALSCLSAVS